MLKRRWQSLDRNAPAVAKSRLLIGAKGVPRAQLTIIAKSKRFISHGIPCVRLEVQPQHRLTFVYKDVPGVL